MIIGFSKYGTGLSGPALDYLTGYLVNGKARDPKPEIVRGDAKGVAQLIDSLPFQRRYSSGVLSFAAGDRVTPEIQEDVMNRFESAVFAGIPSDRRSIVWIKHLDKGRTELHFVVPRVDLGTRKSLNIAPPTPASRHLLDTLREGINRRYGFRDPGDPECVQDVSVPAHIAKSAARANRLGRSVKPDIRELITQRVSDQVASGTIKQRSDVIGFLKSQGFAVSRAGINYVTVVCPGTGERVRLKGTVFREHFRPTDLEPAPARRDPAQLLTLDRRLDRLVEKRATYHRARYGIEELVTDKIQITEEPANDRTRNSFAGNRAAPGEIPPGARATVWGDALRFDEAAQRFHHASGELERAGLQLEQKDRSLAVGFEQMIGKLHRRPLAGAIVDRDDDAPTDRDHGDEMELELEL